MTTPRIFVSHSHADNQFGIQLVQDLRHALSDESAVWYDTSGGLQGGDTWWKEILNELVGREVFLVILSPDSMNSPWVDREINIALNEGKRIIPLFYRSCTIRPDLKTIQMISFLPSNTYEQAFKELLVALRKPKGTRPPPVMPEPLRPGSTHLRSPSVFATLILLILLGGGGFGIYGATTGRWPWNPSHGPSTSNLPGTTAPDSFGVVGQTWHVQRSSTSLTLDGVAWSGSQFVAVGGSGTILISPDGRTWTPTHAGAFFNFNDIACSGSDCVAVGLLGSIFTLTNGSWTSQHSGTSQHLESVAWSGSQFVVVGDNGTILTSLDGHTWHIQNSSITGKLWDVAWLGSQFVVVGVNGTILTSPDGRAWTAQNSGTLHSLKGVARSGLQSVAVGDNGTILTSLDGRTWTTQHSGTSQSLDRVVWSDSQFVAVGDNGTILTSPDGLTWTAQNSGTSQSLHRIAWSGSQLVTVGDKGTILTSP